MLNKTKAYEITSDVIREYTFLEWRQKSFEEYSEIIFISAMHSVHQIQLNNKKPVYIIPETLYFQGITPPSIYLRGLQRIKNK